MAIIVGVVYFIAVTLGGLTGGILFAFVIIAALSGMATGLLSISVSLVYARLREIKEGVGVADIAAVFD